MVTAAPSRSGHAGSHRGSTVVLPLLGAAALGVGAGLAPALLLLAVAALATAAVVVLRPGWVAVALVVASVFEGYLSRVGVPVTKVLAGLLVVAWVLWWSRRAPEAESSARRSPVLAATLAFTVVLLLATAVHNNGTSGLTVVLRYAGFLAVLVVLADLQQRRVLPPDRLARVYVVAAVAAAGCGLVAFVLDLGPDRRAGGPIGDPNDFAFFLLPAVALAVGVRARARRRGRWDLAVVVLVVGILATLSRGALVGLLVLGLYAVAAGMVRIRAAAALTTVVAVAAGVVALAMPGLVSVSLEQKDVVADQNVSERLDLWGAAVRMTASRPVLGQGPGAFSLHHEDYLSTLPDDVNHPLDVAHNTWLEVASELGVLGLLAFGTLLGTAFLAGRRAWRDERDPVGGAVAAALVGTAVAATFVTEQYYLPLWLLCALAVGVSSREGRSPSPEEVP